MRADSATVLVIDDDSSIRESLSNLVRSMGLNVQTCASAQEFLSRQRPDAPSCLVLDVELPGLSGLDLQQELAKGDAQIPIIFITGHGDIPMTVRAMKAGAIDFSRSRAAPRICSTPSSRRSAAVATWNSSGPSRPARNPTVRSNQSRHQLLRDRREQ